MPASTVRGIRGEVAAAWMDTRGDDQMVKIR